MEQCCHKCTRHLQTQVCRQRNYRNRSIVLCAGLTDVHIISKGLFFCGKVSAKSLNKNLVTYTGTVVGSKMKFSRLTASCIYTYMSCIFFHSTIFSKLTIRFSNTGIQTHALANKHESTLQMSQIRQTCPKLQYFLPLLQLFYLKNLQQRGYETFANQRVACFLKQTQNVRG